MCTAMKFEALSEVKATCPRCSAPRVSNACGICTTVVCKECIEFVDGVTFSYMSVVPDELKHTHYCMQCYNTTVAPALANYRSIMSRAKKVFIIDKPQRRPLPVTKQFKKAIQVKDCPDREETVLRLAFRAAELGYNAVLKTNVIYKKVRNAGYQKMIWEATGFPADLDPVKLESY